MLELSTLEEVSFLSFLANGLEAAVVAGLDIARRLGGHGERQPWRLWQLNRVYYVPVAARPGGVHEPDEFHRGIAPSVKLTQCAKSFAAGIEIALAADGPWTDAKSPVKVMRVKAPQGAMLYFRVAGPDGEAALAAVLALVHDGFGEA